MSNCKATAKQYSYCNAYPTCGTCPYYVDSVKSSDTETYFTEYDKVKSYEKEKLKGQSCTMVILDEFATMKDSKYFNKETKEKVMIVYDYVIIGADNDENVSILAEGRFLARDMFQARTIIGQKNPGIALTEETVQLRPFCE